MASSAAGAAGAVDPQVVVLIAGVSDERVNVATVISRFVAATVNSDLLAEDDNSAGAKMLRESTTVEDGHLFPARKRIAEAREMLARYGIAKSAGPDASLAVSADKVDEVDLEEKRSSKMLKRKIPAPKHARLA